MNNFAGLYEIREAKPEDFNFIRSTFLRGVYYGDSWFSLIPKQIFMQNYKSVIEVLLNKATINVACLPDDKDVVIGYSILSNDYLTVHFCYVKAAWRKNGIAKSLVPRHPTAVSHLTKLGKELLPKLSPAIFNPFSI